MSGLSRLRLDHLATQHARITATTPASEQRARSAASRAAGLVDEAGAECARRARRTRFRGCDDEVSLRPANSRLPFRDFVSSFNYRDFVSFFNYRDVLLSLNRLNSVAAMATMTDTRQPRTPVTSELEDDRLRRC